MLIVIGAFILSLIPCILLLIWLKKQNEEPAYQTSFKSAVKYGLLSVFPVIGLAAAFALISLAFPKNMPVLAREAYKDFILAAFTEEFVKFMLFRKVLKESRYNYSWRDITAFMIVIGAGFEMMESIVYALMTNPGQILVRGILIMHAGYAYIMGKYYGKALVTGKKGWYVFAFLVPFLLHGLYDYGLTPELQEWNDNTVVISVTLAFIGLITLIRLILFFRKAKKEEIYTRPLLAAAEEEA
ncbi:MAG: PrsW family intramembrane metalloprotease [Erysipelotrichaceae bacterium]|nr:PrsW family intramembrane metalloprotease [Erysipelotrichaceae bacterium]